MAAGAFQHWVVIGFVIKVWITFVVSTTAAKLSAAALNWFSATLISSLLDIASSLNMLFHQSQYILYSKHHGLAFALLFVPVLFADCAKYWFVIVWYGFRFIHLKLYSIYRPSFHNTAINSNSHNKWSLATVQQTKRHGHLTFQTITDYCIQTQYYLAL